MLQKAIIRKESSTVPTNDLYLQCKEQLLLPEWQKALSMWEYFLLGFENALTNYTSPLSCRDCHGSM
jgi:hypothetical protein